MSTQDEEIARHLAQAAAAGELRGAPSYGKPLAEDAEWDATPVEFRLPFKVLKNAGIAPPEVAWFHERARLAEAVACAADPAEKAALQRRLSDLQQKIALRLEAMRVRGSV